MGDGGVVLLGGSFDPPHRGHVELGAAARDAVAPGAELVFVPAARSPHKARGPNASDADRLAMLHLAAAEADRASVWDEEIERARHDRGPSYWAHTLDVARERLGADTPIRFIIGADQALAFHRWREPRRILSVAEPIVILRTPIATREDLFGAMRDTDAWEDDELEAWRGWCVELPLHGASSTIVRSALRAEDHSIAERLLVPAVLEYVHRRGLYRDER